MLNYQIQFVWFSVFSCLTVCMYAFVCVHLWDRVFHCVRVCMWWYVCLCLWLCLLAISVFLHFIYYIFLFYLQASFIWKNLLFHTFTTCHQHTNSITILEGIFQNRHLIWRVANMQGITNTKLEKKRFYIYLVACSKTNITLSILN